MSARATNRRQLSWRSVRNPPVRPQLQPVQVPVIKKKKASKKNSPDYVQQALGEILSSFTGLLRRPESLLVLLVSLALILTHAPDLTTGILSELVPKNTQNKFGIWFRDNFPRLLGFFLFIPAIYDIAQKNLKPALFFASFIFIFSLPTQNIYQYAAQAALLHTYFRVRGLAARVVTIAIVIFTYMVGHEYLGQTFQAKNSTSVR